MDLSCSRETRGGLAIVIGRIRNETGSPKRVRIANALEGPVLPPRRRGVPEPGWDAEGYTCRVAGESTEAFGYVCAADAPADGPPARIDSVAEPKDARDGDGSDESEENVRIDDSTTVAHQTLGDHRPPRKSIADGSRRSSTTGRRGVRTPTTTREKQTTKRTRDPLEAHLDRMVERLERLERLEDGSLTVATRIVSDAGDLSAFRRDLRRLDADVERLGALRDRMESLIERRDRLDVPVAILEQLA
ncbi:hypothetical protein ACERIT_05595 [Halopenitus sp. H-Gu1]|uniref:DUF7857 domain-containing protein n=1 Tax=Halopenitus sp. H-Gu1 TaxID=3242697 RepID=UPI00359D1C5D